MEESIPSPPPLATNGESSDKDTFLDLDVRSEEVQEIIGRPPHWLVRGGILLFFGVLALVFLAAFTIEYPEIINAPLKLTATNAPKQVESKARGKLVKLFYKNNTGVEEGQVLAWIESTANHQSVLDLSLKIDSLQKWLFNNELNQITAIQFAGSGYLGELQANFQAFEQSFRKYISFSPSGFYYQKKELLMEEMSYIDTLYLKLKDQRKMKMDFSNQDLSLQQTESAIINNKMLRLAKQKEIMELNREIRDQRATFTQSVSTFKSTIDEWKQNHVLRAPEKGKLAYAEVLEEKQIVDAGQILFFIQPKNVSLFGEIEISQDSFGKVKEGQQVMVKLSAYPYNEYGSITGTIDYLSDVPLKDNFFFARVYFPEGFKTNYGHELSPVNGMRGQAEIITQDMRLLERIYNNVTKRLK